MNSFPAALKEQIVRWQRWSLAIGVLGAILCVLGAVSSFTQFLRAYLIAYLYFLGMAHGCFVVLMIYHLTGGAWGFLVRRILEAGMRTLPLLAVLFLPLAFGVRELYVWAQPGADEFEEIRHKVIYLNVPFFWARAALYFALWIGFTYLLSSWSKKQDDCDSPEAAQEWTRRLALLSGPGLVSFGVTITFAAVDWIMSLQPGFRSTIFGPVFASGEILTGFGCTLLVMAWLVMRPPLGDVVSVEALNDLGNLLFTFLVIWGYLNFFQYMIIWIADLPYDVIWYLPRTRGGWKWVTLVLVVFHFVVPFFLLLMRDIKQRPRALAAIAGLIVLMHLLFLYFQVLPAFPDTGIAEHWLDVVAPFAVGGFWLAYLLRDLEKGPLLPLHDLNQTAALHYRELDREQQEAQHA